jgi:hypothetical protein
MLVTALSWRTYLETPLLDHRISEAQRTTPQQSSKLPQAIQVSDFIRHLQALAYDHSTVRL